MRDGGVVAEHKYKRMASICYVGVATEATEPPHAPTNASRASTTTATLRPAHSTLRPTFSATYRLLAGTHDAAHPTRHQQPHLSRAPAGHHSPTKPTLQRASIDAMYGLLRGPLIVESLLMPLTSPVAAVSDP